MSRMTWKPGHGLRAVLALGALAATGAVTVADAQVVVAPRAHVTQEDCKCVDKDGKPIERCTCFVMPDVEGIVARVRALPGRARLGITLSSDDTDQARGARVSSVMEDGPAEAAGIREGDIITKLDGKSLLESLGAETEKSFDQDGALPVQRLMALVRKIEPGQDVAVEYLRDGERRTATVKARELGTFSFAYSAPELAGIDELRERVQELRLHALDEPMRIRLRADSLERPRLMWSTEPGAQGMLLWTNELGGGILGECPPGEAGTWSVLARPARCPGGLQLVELNPGLAEYFGTTRGVLVSDVHADSKTGLRAGDVILAVGDREATAPDRVRRILGSYGPDEEVTVRIMRQKKEMSVQGTLGR